MFGATPDETRLPESLRESVLVTGRRLVRGPPRVPESVGHWPGGEAEDRPEVKSPESEP